MAVCPLLLPAQDLTGIWRGTFVNTTGMAGEKYKYEIQMKQSPKHSLEGVTYSYSYASKVFYGKADLQGIFMDKTGNLIVKENKMIEFKVTDASTPCLMTCYLQYHKEGALEYLEGTYSSVTMTLGTDCGTGRVYLERVQNSDFTKEDFLLRKERRSPQRIKPGADDNLVDSAATTAKPAPDKPSGTPKDSTATAAKPRSKTPATTKPGNKTTTKPGNSSTAKTTKPKPAAPSATPKRSTTPATGTARTQTPRADTARHKPDASIATVTPPADPPVSTPKTLAPPRPLPVPRIIAERENKLVKTIVTHSPDIKIQLYDNGEIDDDTITVYHNNEVVVYKKRLSNEAINITLGLQEGVNTHELVMVADNLGRIPPNTALMVVTTGGKRYELFISSTEQRNAKVVIEYQPQP
ncbi:hypothetical protein [Deminuibacter soli]|uniref:Uncharacterized protein n=1 Tax=Deminuibacter soli TaxID=2291815 RepID=A0A3E1NCR0_9BACT|nr:hypothetical protein [Deminuibacter soli]RFM25617.1 hypothetical protein DXN05_24075 [Deminuibacter soli]